MRIVLDQRPVTDGARPVGGVPRDSLGEAAGADPVVAGATVDRPVVARNEGNSRVRAAFRADDGMHLTRGLTSALLPAQGATRWAALRLVHESLFLVKRLLAGRENELAATVSADKRSVLELHP